MGTHSEGQIAALAECGAVLIKQLDTGNEFTVEVLGTEVEHEPVLMNISMFGRFDFVLLLPWWASQEIEHDVRQAGEDFASALSDMIREWVIEHEGD